MTETMSIQRQFAPSEPFDLTDRRVYVAGHRGMVGAALVRRLAGVGCELLTASRDEVDLERQQQAEEYIGDTRPDVVVIAAAKVGGIFANRTFPADFISDNIAIARNLIHASYKSGVRKLLFLGSSCIYPRLATQPMAEEELLSGPLEPTNEWYAVAKIAGIKLCQAYRRQYGVDFIKRKSKACPRRSFGVLERRGASFYSWMTWRTLAYLCCNVIRMSSTSTSAPVRI
jgi:GDP-L-fucose synthase